MLTPVLTRLDATCVNEFKKTAESLIHDSGSVVLDLQHLTYVDSAGLGGLVSIYKLLTPSRRLCLTSVAPRIVELLHFTRLDTLFDVIESVESVIES